MHDTAAPGRPGAIRRTARRHPLTLFLAIGIGLTWPIQFGLLASGTDLSAGLLLELVFLLGGATLIAGLTEGRPGIRRLYAGAIRWRIGFGRFAVFTLAMPALTLLTAAATGTLHTPAGGWATLAGPYLLQTFLVGVLLGNVWEETAWGGFLQSRLMARHGLLTGSLLTAVPFFVIHVPLAFAANGWRGTTWSQAGLDWALLALAAPFFRYLIGTQLIDTGGSVLAIGLLHASFNGSGQLAAIPGGWQHIPAMILLTIAVAVHRRRHGRSTRRGHAPALVPAREPAPQEPIPAVH